MGTESLQEESMAINCEEKKTELPSLLSSLKKWRYKIMEEEEA
jgi:hypothetical protein